MKYSLKPITIHKFFANCFWIALSCLFIALSAYADALSELNSSPEMSKFEQKGNIDDLESPRWLKPGTEFADLFSKSDGALSLNIWITPVSGSFIAGWQSSLKYKEYVESERTYSSSRTADIKVRILVPHPKYASMLQFGLINAFAELEPPRLEFESSETLDLAGQKAKLYMLKDSSCMLTVKTVKSAIIQLTQEACTNMKDIVSLAELLDYKRLERKLFS